MGGVAPTAAPPHLAGVGDLFSKTHVSGNSEVEPTALRMPKRILQSAYLSRAQDFGGFFHIPRLDPQNGAEASLAGRCSSHSSQIDFG